MDTFNKIMTAFLILTIISAGVFGDRFVRLSYKTRFFVVIAYVLVFGGWITLNHAR